MCGNCFHAEREVGACNAQPTGVEEAGTLSTFRRHLDGHMNKEAIEGHRPSKAEGFLF